MSHPDHDRESKRYNATLNSYRSAQRSINMAVQSQRWDRYWTRRIISRSFIVALTALLKGWAEVKTSSCLWKTKDAWALFGDVSCCFTQKLWQGTADCWPETLSLFCRPNCLTGLHWLVSTVWVTTEMIAFTKIYIIPYISVLFQTVVVVLHMLSQ